MVETLRGVGLFSGRETAVSFSPCEGPVRFSGPLADAPLSELRVAERARTTEVYAGRFRLSLVEHLFAALSVLGIDHGLSVSTTSEEIPLLDGGASLFFAPLRSVWGTRVRSAAPTFVAKPFVVTLEGSRYEFLPAETSTFSVQLTFDHPRIQKEVHWDGSVSAFETNIARARTFVFSRDLEALARDGVSLTAMPESVIVFHEDSVHTAGRPYDEREPAWHKLLDLVGDLYLHGGIPRGHIRATAPGHGRTHRAMMLAKKAQALVSVRP